MDNIHITAESNQWDLMDGLWPGITANGLSSDVKRLYALVLNLAHCCSSDPIISPHGPIVNGLPSPLIFELLPLWYCDSRCDSSTLCCLLCSYIPRGQRINCSTYLSDLDRALRSETLTAKGTHFWVAMQHMWIRSTLRSFSLKTAILLAFFIY